MLKCCTTQCSLVLCRFSNYVICWFSNINRYICKQTHSLETSQWKSYFKLICKNLNVFFWVSHYSKHQTIAHRRSYIFLKQFKWKTFWNRFAKIHWNMKRFRFASVFLYKSTKNIFKQVYWLLQPFCSEGSLIGKLLYISLVHCVRNQLIESWSEIPRAVIFYINLTIN